LHGTRARPVTKEQLATWLGYESVPVTFNALASKTAVIMDLLRSVIAAALPRRGSRSHGYDFVAHAH
jgi:hypothetical protein